MTPVVLNRLEPLAYLVQVPGRRRSDRRRLALGERELPENEHLKASRLQQDAHRRAG